MRPTRVLAIAAWLGATGCLKWHSDEVAMGVGRLTVRNLAAIVKLVSTDERCGFASPAVLDAVRIDGLPGEHGVATWEVTGCTIELPEFTTVFSYCDGSNAQARGTITVNAVKTLTGYVSEDPASPIIPDAPDAVGVELTQVAFDDFKVRQSDDGNVLTMKAGSLSAHAAPRLAMDETLGVCAQVTRHAAFSQVRYASAKLRVKTPDRSFDVDVSRSEFGAQAGQGEARENHLKGWITVWGKKEKVPSDDDRDGLDPDYDRAAFIDSFACEAGLAKPITFDCDLAPNIAQGAARLSVRTLGALARLVSDDAVCGFAGPPGALTTSGAPGDIGQATAARTCTYDFAEPTAIHTDCNGVSTYVQGRATIRARRATSGYLTGEVATPVVPTSRDAVRLDLEATLAGFAVTTSASDSALHLIEGEIAGTVMPRLALDTQTGACSIATPVNELENVRYLRSTRASLVSAGRRFAVVLDGGELDAVSGTKEARQNYLAGTLGMNGEVLSIPTRGAPTLDPEFDPATFAASFACTPNMKLPADEAACSFAPVLAQGAARLVVQLFGKLVRTADLDTHCGFSSTSALVPTSVSGLPYSAGTMRFGIADCVLSGTAAQSVHRDCEGKETFITGAAAVTARRNVNGRLVLENPPIEPQSPTSVRVDLDSATFSNFTLYELEPGQLAADATMTVASGQLSGVFLPVTGESASKPGTYFIKTPVGAFEGIKLANARVSIQSAGRRFNVRVDDSNLVAFNGSYGGSTNRLGGTITIDGRVHQLPSGGPDALLDPEYSQASFDAAYACTPDLARVIR